MDFGSPTAINQVLASTGVGTAEWTSTVPVENILLTGGVQGGSAGNRLYHDVHRSRTASASVTGTMKITFPRGWVSTMFAVKILGYNYLGFPNGGPWEALVGAYNYSGGGGSWYNYSADIAGSPPFSQVRLAYDGEKVCILLGNTSTGWKDWHVAAGRHACRGLRRRLPLAGRSRF